jgi:N-methylhydantoinase A
VPDERLDMVVDGHTISVPTFDIETIGAGGGSVAWVDSGGILRVGPQSAGANPGPASYGRGGALPTVTDANLILGRYDAGAPLGGTIVLDWAAAFAAIERHVAKPLGMSVERAAVGIVRIVNALMMNAVRMISVERGRDVRDFTLVAYGGAGPTHAAEIARELTIPRVLVPPFPGCASAFGAVIAGSRRDYIRTIGRTVKEVDLTSVGTIVSRFEADARAALRADGFDGDSSTVETWFDLRYQGQAHELSVRASAGPFSSATITSAVEGFHKLHFDLYGHAFHDVEVELVNVRIKGLRARPEPPMWWNWHESEPDRYELAPVRSTYFQEVGETIETKVLLRQTLKAGDSVEGPAVIHQLDSTILVPPAFVAEALDSGSLVLHSRDDRQDPTGARRVLEAVSA